MLGIDLDNVDWYILCKAKHELIYLFGKDNVKIYKTYKGYHIRVNVDIPFDKALSLRIYFYDDDKRLLYDEERQRIGSVSLVDVLYTEKIAGRARVDKYGNVMKKYSEKYKEEDVTESVCT